MPAPSWLRREREPAPQRTTRIAPRVLTAAGTRVTSDNAPLLGQLSRTDQQAQAWRFRRSVPEMRYVGGFVSSQVSRVRWFAAEDQGDGAPPVPLRDEDPDPNDREPSKVSRRTAKVAMQGLALLDLNRRGASMAGRLAENFEYAGECYLLGEEDDRTREQTWTIRSVTEIHIGRDGTSWLRPPGATGTASGRQLNVPRRGPGGTPVLPDPSKPEAALWRLWSPHPECHDQADIKMESNLGVLREIELYDAGLRASAASRISSGQMLYMPDELTLTRPGAAPTTDPDDDAAEDAENPVLAELTEAIMAPITSEEDPSALVPVVITGPAQGPGDKPMADYIKLIPIPRQDVDEILAKRESAVLKLAHGIDFPAERLTGLGQTNHWCCDQETEALTTRGWLRHDEISEGDTVLTLNHETGLSEWCPVQALYRAKVVNEPMVGIEARCHSSLTTRAHRWPLLSQRGGINTNKQGERINTRRQERLWSTSAELNDRDHIITAAPSADIPTVAKYDDDLVELVAWYWTEGSSSGTRSLTIHQSHTANPERVDRIRAALTRLWGPASERMHRSDLAPRWREGQRQSRSAFGGPVTTFTLNKTAAAGLREAAPDKILGREFVLSLTLSQLELFIDISAQGDGWHYRCQGRLDMWQRRYDALEAYELALILSGRMVTRGTSSDGYWVSPHRARSTNPVAANKKTAKAGRPPIVTEQEYTGVVWCPTTANHSWFARRHGTTYFTGNSGAVITDDEVTNHLEPRLTLYADSLTSAFLRDYCLLYDCPPEEVRWVCVWFDASELAQPADPWGRAKEAHAAGAISDEALRDKGGFGDDDAPSDAERITRLLTGANTDVASIPYIAKLATLDVQDPRVKEALDEAAQMAQRLHDRQAGGPQPRVIDAQQAPSGTSQRPASPALPSTGTTSTPPSTAGPKVSLTAAADPTAAPADPPRWKVDRTTGRRLVAIDRDLVTRVHAHAEAATTRAIERAANRIRARMPEAQRAEHFPRGSDAVEVVAHLGADVVGAGGEDLFADAFDKLEEQWFREVDKAGAAVETLLGKVLPGPPDPAVTAAAAGRTTRLGVAARLSANAQAAWRWLLDKLRQRARQVLFGETDGDPVPMSLMTGAVSLVGGTTEGWGGVQDDGTLVDGPASGPGTGDVALDALRVNGVLVRGHEWDYFPGISRESFHAHLDLDQQTFESWTDPVLAVRAEHARLVKSGYYHPQDHQGCRCGSAPVAIIPMTANPDPTDPQIGQLMAQHLGVAA